MIIDKSECLEWCFGDLITNSVRGKVAEFIVEYKTATNEVSTTT